MADEGMNSGLNGETVLLPIRGKSLTVPMDFWPDHKSGITLLATMMADTFFSAATKKKPAAPMGMVVRCLPTGELRQLMFGPDVEQLTPEAATSWAAFFTAMMREEGVIAGFHVMEGHFFRIEADQVQKDSPHPALISSIYLADEGFFMSRVAHFERNEEGIPVPVGPVKVSSKPQSFGPIIDGIYGSIGKGE